MQHTAFRTLFYTLSHQYRGAVRYTRVVAGGTNYLTGVKAKTETEILIPNAIVVDMKQTPHVMKDSVITPIIRYGGDYVIFDMLFVIDKRLLTAYEVNDVIVYKNIRYSVVEAWNWQDVAIVIKANNANSPVSTQTTTVSAAASASAAENY
jgi:hypothetical protein